MKHSTIPTDLQKAMERMNGQRHMLDYLRSRIPELATNETEFNLLMCASSAIARIVSASTGDVEQEIVQAIKNTDTQAPYNLLTNERVLELSAALGKLVG